MKAFVAALCLALTLPVFASEVPTTDRDKMVQHLERTRDNFLKSVDGLSEAQWQYKAAPEKWSIAQCAEHIAASESLIRGAVTKSLEAPAAAPAENAAKDELILKAVPDRSRKFTAPEPLQPTNRFGSPAAAVEEFRKQRVETLKTAHTDADLRMHAAPNPALGLLDAHGWLLFLSAHTERHTLQIEEVKASEGYPKN